MKAYIPPKNRKNFRLLRKINFFTMSLTVVFLGCFYSLTSPFQPKLAKGVSANTQKKTEIPVVKDSIVASVAHDQNQVISLSKVGFVVKNLPFERVWPVRGRITTYYSSYHPALDIAAPAGTPIHPFSSGVITLVRNGGNLGNNLVIAHTGGFETMYAHLSKIDVRVGDQVDLTTVIGLVGSTGYATGPHLHFQVSQNGHTLNPLSVL